MDQRGSTVTVVIDASTALRAFLEDESVDAPPRRDVAGEELLAPPVFEIEVANALVVSVRRGRQAIGPALDILDSILELVDTSVEVDGLAVGAAILAHRTGLTAYDASYLALAASRSVPVWTHDRQMAQAAVALGIPVVS